MTYQAKLKIGPSQQAAPVQAIGLKNGAALLDAASRGRIDSGSRDYSENRVSLWKFLTISKQGDAGTRGLAFPGMHGGYFTRKEAAA
jgi:hypothetical protein